MASHEQEITLEKKSESVASLKIQLKRRRMVEVKLAFKTKLSLNPMNRLREVCDANLRSRLNL